MRKAFKKALAITLASTMMLSLAACGKGSSSNSSSPVSKDGTIDTSSFETIKFLVLGNKPTNGRMEAAVAKVNEKLKEKVNAEIVLQYVEWADWQTQYNLQLASGDSSIDLITTATDWLDAWPNVKKGSFLTLTEDMLKTYAPKTWESVSADHWDQCKYNDKIYLIPEDNYAQYTNHGWYYRGDWAKEFGLSDINTFEDMGKYMQGIVDNKKDVIPWDVSGTAANGNALANGYIQSTTANLTLTGIPVGLSTIFYGKSIDDPFTLVSPYMDGNTFEDFAVMMKSWADKGYWRADVLNYDGDTREEFFAGLTGVDQHHSMTFYSNVKPTMDTKIPGSDAKMFSWSEPSKNLLKTSITHGALAIGANSKHPERALMVYDLLRNDEEIYRLYNWGIEGTDYVITSDNKLDHPEGYDSTKDALDTNFWCGRNDNFELNNASWWDGKDDMIANYDTYAKEDPYGKVIIDTTNIETKIAAMADVCANYIPKIAFGKVDDPKKEVAAFRQALKDAGYQEVFDEIQKQLSEFKGK